MFVNDKTLKEIIDVRYEKILEEVKDGTMVNGKPVDLNNPKQIAVAFYEIALIKSSKSHQSIISMYQQIIEDLKKNKT